MSYDSLRTSSSFVQTRYVILESQLMNMQVPNVTRSVKVIMYKSLMFNLSFL